MDGTCRVHAASTVVGEELTPTDNQIRPTTATHINIFAAAPTPLHPHFIISIDTLQTQTLIYKSTLHLLLTVQGKLVS